VVGRLAGTGPAGRLGLQIPLFRAPAACWCAREMAESTDTSQLISPAASARVCNLVTICAQIPFRCHRRNSPYTVCQHPYSPGTSRHGAPVRVRHRITSINWRLLHLGGRPGFLPTGNNGSSTAHCSSVKSARPATGTVCTRSPDEGRLGR
jgi:hypothetical protein